jgi:hypothetical protein
MLKKTQHLMHKVQSNYCTCTGRSSENICSSNGGTEEKVKDRMKLMMVFSEFQRGASSLEG